MSPWGTVRNHLSIAIQKLNAHNRVEAARIAEEKGWLKASSRLRRGSGPRAETGRGALIFTGFAS